jgi:hypothetical protein
MGVEQRLAKVRGPRASTPELSAIIYDHEARKLFANDADTDLQRFAGHSISAQTNRRRAERGGKSGSENHTYRMETFYEWLGHLDICARLRLLETYYTFDPAQYNQLFADELEKVIQRVRDPAHRQVLERLRDFNFVGYISASVNNAGIREYRQRQEATADVASKLLMGKLFSGFDERISGPMDLRFKKSVGNCIRNIIEKLRNRRRNLPTAAIEYEPAARSSPVQDDEQMVEDFRKLVRSRLGDLAVSIFDLRAANGETKSLIGSPSVGSPSGYVIKRVVGQIKDLARDYAERLGNSAFLRDVERAMARESETVQKRLTARQSAGL